MPMQIGVQQLPLLLPGGHPQYLNRKIVPHTSHGRSVRHTDVMRRPNDPSAGGGRADPGHRRGTPGSGHISRGAARGGPTLGQRGRGRSPGCARGWGRRSGGAVPGSGCFLGGDLRFLAVCLAFFACFRLFSIHGTSGNGGPPRTCFPTATSRHFLLFWYVFWEIFVRILVSPPKKWSLVPGVMPHPGDPGDTRAVALPGVCPTPGLQGASRSRGLPDPGPTRPWSMPGVARPPPVP